MNRKKHLSNSRVTDAKDCVPPTNPENVIDEGGQSSEVARGAEQSETKSQSFAAKSALQVVRKYVVYLGLVLIFIAAIPVLHFSMKINPADPVPEHWRLPPQIGDWGGDRVFYSPDPSVQRVFFESKITEPFVCPVSGAPLQLMSEAEVRLLPDDVEIERRIYRRSDEQRWVIMLITGTSREGIHRPEWCLAAQGFTIGTLRYLSVDYKNPFKIGVYPLLPANALPEYQPRDYFVYWFEGPNNIRTPYHAERILRSGLDRILHGKVQRWAYFSIQLRIPAAFVANPEPYLAETAAWLVGGQMQVAK